MTERGNFTVYGFERSVLVKWPVELPDLNFLKGKSSITVNFRARVNLLVCKDTCVPEKHDLQRELTVSTEGAIGESPDRDVFAQFEDLYPVEAPDGLPLYSVDNDILIDISDLIRVSDSYDDLRNNLQVFPKPSAPSSGIQQSQLVNFSLPPSVEGRIGILQPFANLKKGELGAVLAISEKISRSGKNLFFDITPQSFADTSIRSGAGTVTSRGNLLFRSGTSEQTHYPIRSAPVLSLSVYLLFLAFVGGLILNLMPCVLPVLSIKIFSVVECCRRRQSLLPTALSYTLGVVFAFTTLALIVYALRTAGHSIGWGFQFQSIYFLYFMAGAVFLFSLSLMGGYGLTIPLSNDLNEQCNKTKHPLLKSFLEGILATLLSTPCSAPIVATVLAFALTSPLQYSLPVFVTMGLGLASPLLLFSLLPSLSNLIPKPGAWMIRFRQFLAIILMGTVVWLLDVIQSINPDAVPYALYLLFSLAVLAWLSIAIDRRFRIILILTALVTFYYFAEKASRLSPVSIAERTVESAANVSWLRYDTQSVSTAIESGSSVFIDFTAAWCITCKFNERFVINTADVMSAITSSKTIAFKADWTDGDSAITAAIKNYGAEGVPLYVVHHPGKSPMVLSTLPSKQEIIDAITSR
jgi:thiol:disulfide interchange protein DsbD